MSAPRFVCKLHKTKDRLLILFTHYISMKTDLTLRPFEEGENIDLCENHILL